MNVGNAASAMPQAKALPAPTDKPVIAGLAGHVRSFWIQARDARVTIEQEMLEALRSRRGEYSAEKLQQIQQDNQPAIYMMVAAAKMRQIEALMRDVMIGTGAEKPWTIRPTPDPELPPHMVQLAVDQLTMEIQQSVIQGIIPSMQQAQERLRTMRDELMPRVMEEASRMASRMEAKMEDQLLEGNFLHALDQFITDLATFKTAFLAGPIVRRKPKLQWGPNGELAVSDQLTLEWERVDPFDMYPAAWATSIDTAPLIRRHRLTRAALNEMIGVDGFDEAKIRAVLDQYDRDGLHEWLSIDTQKAHAEGKDRSFETNTGLIDALQYWGSASGKMLVEWGMDPAQVPDTSREYQVEAWLIGQHVIKAVLNADPLSRRPYYAASFHPIPGSVWGNAPYDLMKDCQAMCNAAARSLAANLGISSGPQVAIISDRLPPGAEVTEMFPWKIWQFTSDPMGSTAKPIEFFQPSSNAQELVAVYERFSAMADEYTGIPRYMAGFETAGAGRTASGMSMMIGNASKALKQVVSHVDLNVLTRALERLYYYNMRFGTDPELKGDVNIVARGALSLVTKEAAQVRTTEFLQATANPVDMQILGLEGRAELLRGSVRRLDLNPDKVVPPPAVLRQRAIAQQVMQAQQTAMGGPQEDASNGGDELQNGAPASDHYSPKPQ